MIILIDGKPTLCKEALVFELLRKNFVIQRQYMDDVSIMNQLSRLLIQKYIIMNASPSPFWIVMEPFVITLKDDNPKECKFDRDLFFPFQIDQLLSKPIDRNLKLTEINIELW